MEAESLESRLRELEVFTFARPPEPDEDPTGRLAYRAMCEKLDKQDGGFFRFPIDSVVEKLDRPDLKLRHCGIGDKGARALAETIKINNTIVSLDLTDNHLTAAGAEPLVNALVANKGIRAVDFSDNRLGVHSVTASDGQTIGALVRQLLAKNTSITDLCLRGNKIGDRDMALIAEGVVDNVTITRLDLSYNDIGVRGAQAIADMLAHGSADLRELRLEWTQFQRVGSLTVLRDGLQQTGTVRKFSMAWCGIGDEGGEVLGDVIRGSSVLEEVDVAHNRIGTRGGEAIARGIAESTTLVRLILCDNPLKDNGCAAIARALRDNRSVNLVDLRDTGAGKITEGELKETLAAKSSAFKIELPRSLFQHDAW